MLDTKEFSGLVHTKYLILIRVTRFGSYGRFVPGLFWFLGGMNGLVQNPGCKHV